VALGGGGNTLRKEVAVTHLDWRVATACVTAKIEKTYAEPVPSMMSVSMLGDPCLMAARPLTINGRPTVSRASVPMMASITCRVDRPLIPRKRYCRVLAPMIMNTRIGIE
jgi:hypothetical protein